MLAPSTQEVKVLELLRNALLRENPHEAANALNLARKLVLQEPDIAHALSINHTARNLRARHASSTSADAAFMQTSPEDITKQLLKAMDMRQRLKAYLRANIQKMKTSAYHLSDYERLGLYASIQTDLRLLECPLSEFDITEKELHNYAYPSVFRRMRNKLRTIFTA